MSGISRDAKDNGNRIPNEEQMRETEPISPQSRRFIIVATLLALFLGALDTLAVSAAMPTIVADLGGIHLYSWVFTAYLLSRAVALPIFGKLSDMFDNRLVCTVSLLIFMVGSLGAGFSENMMQLILARVVQGIGCGGNFALTYIILSDIAEPNRRGKMMSLASFVWGLASLTGPTFGGLIAGYLSWHWIFFINLPLGALSIFGIVRFLKETRQKDGVVAIDYAGAIFLTTTILSLLLAFMMGGRAYPWLSVRIMGLLALSVSAGYALYRTERKAEAPIFSFDLFKERGFGTGVGTVFLSSFAIFTISAFVPLYIQSVLGRSPDQVGLIMMGLSMGWSAGALFCGRMAHRVGEKRFSVIGAVMLGCGCLLTLTFSPDIGVLRCVVTLLVSGVGMGFVSISTLLIVQKGVDASDLGVATSAHQFARTMGGTIGIGISGGIITRRFMENLEAMTDGGLIQQLPDGISERIRQNVENIFQTDIQAMLPDRTLNIFYENLGGSILAAFWFCLVMALLCVSSALLLPSVREAEAK